MQRIQPRPNTLGTALALAIVSNACQAPPQPLTVEAQPLAANADALGACIDSIGSPLPADTAAAAVGRAGAAPTQNHFRNFSITTCSSWSRSIRKSESRSAVALRAPVLQQGGYTPAIVKVINEAATTKTGSHHQPAVGPRSRRGQPT